MTQLTELIELVAKHCPEELKVFYKFVETTAELGRLNNEFESIIRLLSLFVDTGYLTKESHLYWNAVL